MGGRVACAIGRHRVQCQQNAPHARIGAQGQRIHACVFKTLNRQALRRAEVVGKDGCAPAPVRRHVGQCGAVPVDAGNSCALVIDVGQTHAVRIKVGHGLALQVKGGGVGHQHLGVLPQRFQVHVECTGVVHQQGSVALALQHRAAVGRSQAEKVALLFGVVAVVADAVIHPVAQTLQTQYTQ